MFFSKEFTRTIITSQMFIELNEKTNYNFHQKENIQHWIELINCNTQRATINLVPLLKQLFCNKKVHKM